MLLTKRETYIAIAVATLIALALGYFLGFKPYRERVADIAVERQATESATDALQVLFTQQREMKKVWAGLSAGGMGNTPAEAEGLLRNALVDWSDRSGVKVQKLDSAHPSTDGKFTQINFHLVGDATSKTIAELLWRIETTTMPLRMSSLQITPRTEGRDELQVQLDVAIECLTPDAPAKAGGPRGTRT